MKTKDLQKASDLKERIEEVEKFLRVFNEEFNVRRGNGQTDINGFINFRKDIKVSIFGWRDFGLGSHETDIKIPFDMVDTLERLFKQKLDELNKEFEAL